MAGKNTSKIHKNIYAYEWLTSRSFTENNYRHGN